MADPIITRVEPLRPRGLEVLLHLDDGEPIEVTLEALERSRLGVGDSLPSNRRRTLMDEDAEVRVRDAALNLISYRARTRVELRRRLHQKGFSSARIDSCLDRLQLKGFIDDEAVAAAFVRDRLRHRPRGRLALLSELRAKGITGDLAQRTIDRVFDTEEVDDTELARSVAESWVRRQPAATLATLASATRSPARDQARRRLAGFLQRRGFRGDALSIGIERATSIACGREPEQSDEPPTPRMS